MDLIRPEWGVYLTTIICTSKKGIRTAAELQEHGFAGSAAQQAYPEGLQALLLPSEGLQSNSESLLIPSEPCWQPVRKQALKVHRLLQLRRMFWCQEAPTTSAETKSPPLQLHTNASSEEIQSC